jgi:hypothetical protein
MPCRHHANRTQTMTFLIIKKQISSKGAQKLGFIQTTEKE